MICPLTFCPKYDTLYMYHLGKVVPMKPPRSPSGKERAKRSRLSQLLHQGGLMRGNLVTMARTCGNPRCRCARGEKHVSLYVSKSTEGKQRLTYVPKDWEEKIREWVDRHHRVREL